MLVAKKNIPSPLDVRKTILKMLYESKSSHLGSNMSAVEMLIAMYAVLDLNKIKRKSFDRSRVFISKGHCAAATYATLIHYGLLPKISSNSYLKDKSYFTAHVNHLVNGVEHSTGALGHGLPVATGCALGLKSRGILRSKVLAICGDGEIQEGSIWESIMFAAQKKLDNLTILIDNNQISSITDTKKVINMNPLVEKFKSFGLNVSKVNGHNVNSIIKSIKKSDSIKKPKVIICETIKGKDVPFAEGKAIWHYSSLNEEKYKFALEYLSNLKK